MVVDVCVQLHTLVAIVQSVVRVVLFGCLLLSSVPPPFPPCTPYFFIIAISFEQYVYWNKRDPPEEMFYYYFIGRHVVAWFGLGWFKLGWVLLRCAVFVASCSLIVLFWICVVVHFLCFFAFFLLCFCSDFVFFFVCFSSLVSSFSSYDAIVHSLLFFWWALAASLSRQVLRIIRSIIYTNITRTINNVAFFSPFCLVLRCIVASWASTHSTKNNKYS